MRRVALSLILLAAAPAFADSEARQGSDWVRITAKPCKNEKVLANIAARGENALDYRAAHAKFQGEFYAACWAPEMHTGKVQVRYDDGDKGEVPMRDFKPVPEA